jgi:hypothetical protein
MVPEPRFFCRMKTPEKLFTELAGGDLVCPCETYCAARKAVPEADAVFYKDMYRLRTKIVARHEQFDAFLECITSRLSGLICELIIEKRNSSRKNCLPMHAQLFWSMDSQSVIPEWIYKEAAKKYNLQFAESYSEFERIVSTQFFSICEFITSKFQKQH